VTVVFCDVSGSTAMGERLDPESTRRVMARYFDVTKAAIEPVAAFRLTGLVEGAEFIPRRLDSPLVGRENELAQLLRAYDHAVSERVAYQFTVLGAAGIGKSRLVRELQGRIGARQLAGHCPPYGEGITYWPLAEIEPLSSQLDFTANRDEIALQARRILERLARDRPLVVVLEDLQWAEPTFLDLIDHVTDLARDAPMLLVCVARPELLDLRPGWGGGKLNATTMLLEALSDDESAQLVDNLLLARVDHGTTERIASAAQGNPLYLEEMLAIVEEEGDGGLGIPPTIQALLAARLDRLMPDERAVVECAAVQGQEFRHDPLSNLVPGPLAGRLAELEQALVRKDLIRPTGDETFTFKHLLLRDAAYEALPKEQRADLHERFAAWLELAAPDPAEIRGYHLERAYRYRAELGPVDERTTELARRAATLLAAAGGRANDRSDVHATINLLERAVRLLPEGDPDAVQLYPDLASALAESGDFQRPESLYRSAEELGDDATALRARLRRIWLDQLRGGPEQAGVGPTEAILAEAEELGEETIVAEALSKLAVLHTWVGNYERGEQLMRRSLEHAGSRRDLRVRSNAMHWLGLLMLWGPTPVEEALRECRVRSQSTELGQMARTELFVVQGALLALTGEFVQARELATEGRRTLLELGQRVQYAAISQPVAIIELLAGDAPAEEAILREAHDILDASGERGYLSTIAALLALALTRQGRYDDAEVFADESRAFGRADDLITQIYWRVGKAHVVSSRGRADEARRLAAEAIELAENYDSFDGPIVLVEVASYLAPGDARAALEKAFATASAKGNVVTAGQARELLAALP
jgi:tetratricopeptide (TPR) repeat protein